MLPQRIRLYGADCNQSALVLEAIVQTKVNLTVWLGNYVSATDGGEAYERQRDTIKEVIQTYGTDHIGYAASTPPFIFPNPKLQRYHGRQRVHVEVGFPLSDV